MKTYLLLCAAISAALFIGGCASQNTAANNAGPNGMAQRGAINSGSGIGGGGGLPGRTPQRYEP
ncbi:MAG: hypothetical protein ABIR38_06125 [Chthoniobacterales bacterium]|nr:hypothetical protein [Verrucomicrobiota bacterium]